MFLRLLQLGAISQLYMQLRLIINRISSLFSYVSPISFLVKLIFFSSKPLRQNWILRSYKLFYFLIIRDRKKSNSRHIPNLTKVIIIKINNKKIARKMIAPGFIPRQSAKKIGKINNALSIINKKTNCRHYFQ